LLRFNRFRDHSLDGTGDVVDRRLAFAGTMPMHEVARFGVAEPDRSARVLPREHLQRKIDADGLRALHERRATLRIAKNQKLGRAERLAYFLRAGRMIDAREDNQTARFRGRFEAIDGGPYAMGLDTDLKPCGAPSCLPIAAHAPTDTARQLTSSCFMAKGSFRNESCAANDVSPDEQHAPAECRRALDQ
jgi:hypothetical protein